MKRTENPWYAPLRGLPFWLKIVIALVVDFVDLIVGTVGLLVGVPLVSVGPTMYDGGATIVAVMLTGRKGVWAAWEVFLPTDLGNLIDAFVPTVTILVIADEMSDPSSKLGKRCKARSSCRNLLQGGK